MPESEQFAEDSFTRQQLFDALHEADAAADVQLVVMNAVDAWFARKDAEIETNVPLITGLANGFAGYMLQLGEGSSDDCEQARQAAFEACKLYLLDNTFADSERRDTTIRFVHVTAAIGYAFFGTMRYEDVDTTIFEHAGIDEAGLLAAIKLLAARTLPDGVDSKHLDYMLQGINRTNEDFIENKGLAGFISGDRQVLEFLYPLYKQLLQFLATRNVEVIDVDVAKVDEAIESTRQARWLKYLSEPVFGAEEPFVPEPGSDV